MQHQRQLVRLAEAIGTSGRTFALKGLDGDFAPIEYAVHEIGHALSLRVPLHPLSGLSFRVGKTIDDMESRNLVFPPGLRNEALVLAAEMTILPALGFPHPPKTLRVGLEDTWKDQCQEVLDDLKDQRHAYFTSFIRSDLAKYLGARVVRTINTLISRLP